MQNHKMLQYFKNINELIVEDNNFIEKVKRLCEQIDLFYATFSTFTYINENQMPFIVSAQQVDHSSIHIENLPASDLYFYQELMKRNKDLNFNELKYLQYQKQLYVQAIQQGYDACYYILIYSEKKVAIKPLPIVEATDLYNRLHSQDKRS